MGTLLRKLMAGWSGLGAVGVMAVLLLPVTVRAAYPSRYVSGSALGYPGSSLVISNARVEVRQVDGRAVVVISADPQNIRWQQGGGLPAHVPAAPSNYGTSYGGTYPNSSVYSCAYGAEWTRCAPLRVNAMAGSGGGAFGLGSGISASMSQSFANTSVSDGIWWEGDHQGAGSYPQPGNSGSNVWWEGDHPGSLTQPSYGNSSNVWWEGDHWADNPFSGNSAYTGYPYSPSYNGYHDSYGTYGHDGANYYPYDTGDPAGGYEIYMTDVVPYTDEYAEYGYYEQYAHDGYPTDPYGTYTDAAGTEYVIIIE